MRDIDLNTRILGIQALWQVTDVEVDTCPRRQVAVHVERKTGAQLCCPTCGKPAPGYDSRRRRWRRLDTCQYKTNLEADVPRVECPEHGVMTTSAPWAEPNSDFTAMFEALVIDWLKEASTAAVARLMGLSWNAILLKVGNGPAEGINSRIKAIKVRSHGFRNKERFANAIYFHLGGLDLYLEGVSW